MSERDSQTTARDVENVKRALEEDAPDAAAAFRKAYRVAALIVDRDDAIGIISEDVIDNVLNALAELAGKK